MTRADLEAMECDFLTPEQVAPIIGCKAHGIRVQAHDDPAMLGFPVSVIGKRTRIPRIPFIEFVFGKKENT